MSSAAHPARGRPLVFLGTLLAISIAVRLITGQVAIEQKMTSAPLLAANHSAPPTQTMAEDGPVPVESAEEPAAIAAKAAPATLVEGLEPAPLPQEHAASVNGSNAVGHEMLWMAASQAMADQSGDIGGM